MCRSSAPFSCARFMMLSLNGARQISGNNARISIRTEVAAKDAEAGEIQINSVCALCVLCGTSLATLRSQEWHVDRGARRSWPVTRESHEWSDQIGQSPGPRLRVEAAI